MQAQNITVKNGADTDKTFTLISPSAGWGSVASWYLQEGAISAVFPQWTTMAQKNGSGVQTATAKLRLPSSFTDTVTGLTNVGSHAELNVSVKLPPDFPEALKDDFVAFAVNLFGSEQFRAQLRYASPAT